MGRQDYPSVRVEGVHKSFRRGAEVIDVLNGLSFEVQRANLSA